MQCQSTKVFAVTATVTVEDNNPDVELAVVEFLQQIRINVTIHMVNMQNTNLTDDFQAYYCAVCPSSVEKCEGNTIDCMISRKK